jgi:exosortase/archaeosortase family protein
VALAQAPLARLGLMNAIERAENGRAVTAGLLLGATAIALAILPAVVTLTEVMTRGAQITGADRFLAEWIVPLESRLAAGLLSAVGIPAAIGPGTLLLGSSEPPLVLRISWNCVGWQSLVLFGLTCLTALQGQPARAKAVAVVSGAIAVALLNVTRIAVVGVVAWSFGAVAAVIVHDYGTVLSTVAFLFVFWAIAHKTVLRRD